MSKDMKTMKIVLSILGVIVIMISVVLVVAWIKGKPLNTSPSFDLEGVEDDVQGALWYASLAANSHNAQAWKTCLYLHENKLQLSIDDSRLLTVVDSKKREAAISLGCYVETMCTAFDAFGYDTRVEYSDASVAMTYTKRADAAIDTEKLALLEKRHTDKSAYKNDPIDSAVMDQLLGKYPALSLYQNNTTYFSYLKQLSEDAMIAQSENQDYRDELAEWMRFSDEEAASKRDGLSADMLGLRGIIKSFYTWTMNYEKAKGDGFARQGINTARKQLNGCGAFAVFTGGNTFEEWVDVGRAVQAFWLDCASYEIAVQPFSVALETKPFCDSMQDNLGTDAPIQMILRLGYVDDYGGNCALRRNLSDYIEIFR